MHEHAVFRRNRPRRILTVALDQRGEVAEYSFLLGHLPVSSASRQGAKVAKKGSF
jgi:hypothetical protein